MRLPILTARKNFQPNTNIIRNIQTEELHCVIQNLSLVSQLKCVFIIKQRIMDTVLTEEACRIPFECKC